MLLTVPFNQSFADISTNRHYGDLHPPVSKSILGQDNNVKKPYRLEQTPKSIRSSLPTLVQTRPKDISSKDVSRRDYDPDNIVTISDPNISSYSTKSLRTLRMIDMVPSITDLPKFLYQKDPETGMITRYLAIEDNKDYDTDPHYGISQEWLLFQRQGNQYDRLAEWNPAPELYSATPTFGNVDGIDKNLSWNIDIKAPYVPPLKYYDTYLRYLEYGQSQIEEEDDT